MPSLIRLLVVLAILGGLGYGALWALANLVEPQPRDERAGAARPQDAMSPP